MKRITVSSLLLCFVLTGNLFAQFDGQNGQPSFYSEVEEDNRPSFLQMEEEAMLIERWDNSLSRLGLENVAVLQEVQLQDMEHDIRRQRDEIKQKIHQIISAIEHLETRNDQLEKLHKSLALTLVDLNEESQLLAEMEASDEAEQAILSDNENEMNALTQQLQDYQLQLKRNDQNLLEQQESFMLTESLLSEVLQQEEAIVFLTSHFQRMQEYHNLAMQNTLTP